MTERYMALTVILDKDIREDDAQWIINAIKMVKHVKDVKPEVSNLELDVAMSRVRSELEEKIFKVLRPEWGKRE